jgi:hypothetical protein
MLTNSNFLRNTTAYYNGRLRLCTPMGYVLHQALSLPTSFARVYVEEGYRFKCPSFPVDLSLDVLQAHLIGAGASALDPGMTHEASK